MGKQLKMDLKKAEEETKYDDSLFVEELDDLDNIDDIDEESECLLYKTRLRKLVKDISEFDNFDGIQLSKEGMERLQKVSKFLISMLIFETIGDLNKIGKKKIVPQNIDNALDNITSKSSAIDIALNLLDKDISQLKNLKNSMSVLKANRFINK